MNILFFTPVVATSAIGRMACLAVNELVSNGHTLTVVRTEGNDFQDHDVHAFNADIVPWNDLESRLPTMQMIDVCIYQVGDNFHFHEGCTYWLSRLPGIVCLHDFFLGNLFLGWAQHHRKEAESTLNAWYGEAVQKKYFSYTDIVPFIEGTRDTAPMTEWICSLATGVAVHSNWGSKRVLESCPGPVRLVPLCYNAPEYPGGERKKPAGNPLALLTIGHANFNKRIEQVIEAIASNDYLKANIHYSLAGHIDSGYRDHLSELAKRLGVQLSISGAVDDQTLATMINHADLISCLRWPVLEAASASAIEAMLYGKAIMCMNVGFYAEIPSEFAYKIDIQNEKMNIPHCLENAVNHRTGLAETGMKAKKWASETFNVQSYVKDLIQLAENSLQTTPQIVACRALSAISARWKITTDAAIRHEDILSLAIFS